VTTTAAAAAAPGPVRPPARPAGTPGEVSSTPGQPPLTRWGHTWRIVVALVLGISVLLTTALSAPSPVGDRIQVLIFLDVVLLGPASLVLLAFHRRFPVPVATVVTVLTAVSSLAGGAGLVCLVSIAARRRVREIAWVGSLAVVAGIVFEAVYEAQDDLPLWAGTLLVLLVVAAAVGFGMYLGARRELVHSWRLRAEAADREQALTAEQARSAERARIAREMHDVLAHRISLLSMHAGALAFRDDLPGETVRAEARVIQRTAREALDELRGVLGLLRGPDLEPGPVAPAGSAAVPVDGAVVPVDGAAGRERPQPTLADLDGLVQEARTAGPVEVVDATVGAEPPARLGRHAYRVVQEGLTNARRHAPGARVTVRISGRPGGQLEVEVANEAPARRAEPGGGSGLGLVGLAERAGLTGGTLEHGRTADGGYVVRVLLPWAADDDG
jgi:signal transduction histidine kinase